MIDIEKTYLPVEPRRGPLDSLKSYTRGGTRINAVVDQVTNCVNIFLGATTKPTVGVMKESITDLAEFFKVLDEEVNG